MCFNEYTYLLNERFPDFIQNDFDKEKAEAYLENAASIPSKEKELLIQSFKNCPWSDTLLEYIFVRYKDERKNVWTIAERFDVLLDDIAEQTFANSYTDEAKNSEELSQIVKADILSQMKKLGITHSATVDSIELDGLRRIVCSFHSTNEETRERMLKIFTGYNASDENKRIVAHEYRLWELAPEFSISFSEKEVDEILNMYLPDSAMTSEEDAQEARSKLLMIMGRIGTSQSIVLDKLENSCLERLCADFNKFDETSCNQMIAKINAYPAMDKNKEPFLERVQNHITSIWAKEDSGTFDKLFLSTNLLVPAEVQKAKTLIQKQDRANAGKDYLKALNLCTYDNIKRARKSQMPSAKIYLCSGFILEILGFLIADLTYEFFLIGCIFNTPGLLLIGYYLWMKRIYNTLTFKKRPIHSILNTQVPLTTVYPAHQFDKSYAAKPVPPATPVPPANSTNSSKPIDATFASNHTSNDSSLKHP